jgi:hypothetical protein
MSIEALHFLKNKFIMEQYSKILIYKMKIVLTIITKHLSLHV